MEKIKLIKILEALLLSASKPLTIAQLQGFLSLTEEINNNEIKEAINCLKNEYENRALVLQEVASGYTFFVRKEYGEWVTKMWEEKPQKYTRAVLETLAIIAYRQPVTRGDIEDIRGVAVSSHIIKTLLEREWIRIVGHKDILGKPALYASTKIFLDYFGLKSLEELPSINELASFTDLEPFQAELLIEEVQKLPNKEIEFVEETVDENINECETIQE